MEKLYRQVRIDKKVSLEKVVNILKTDFNISITKQALNLFELGRLNLKPDVRKKLSEYYGIPFNLEKEINFRKYREIDDDILYGIIGKARLYVDEMNTLEKALGIYNKNIFFPQDYILHDIKELEFVVSKLRENWELGTSPINNVQSLIESNGIKIFRIDEYLEGFHGMQIELEKNKIIIISTRSQLNGIKNDISIVRLRATALHELAHIILPFANTLDTKTVESICTSFTGMLLMPKDIMQNALGENRKEFSLKELLCLKATWGLSLQSMLYTARNRDIISDELLRKTLLLVKSHSILNDNHILYEPDEVPENKQIYNPEYAKYKFIGIEKSFRHDWLKERFDKENSILKRRKNTQK